ncbi:hypothetical protein BC936DRAFT_150137 [Jimgerdemannia flammicorona]|uniref:Uncharacterized protein n=2 Tax=Jimgerdemannia flammicorona TaxID=994334 RepID=A0A433QE24_9FUNG|nr:hypothetical protein BC936DRAFT_150137 [Jimgerdemannia flammicorona]RUS28011.1 hypothetical protein BC938DRAFT_482464 [Jimgerdemannia flammicorona]
MMCEQVPSAGRGYRQRWPTAPGLGGGVGPSSLFESAFNQTANAVGPGNPFAAGGDCALPYSIVKPYIFPVYSTKLQFYTGTGQVFILETCAYELLYISSQFAHRQLLFCLLPVSFLFNNQQGSSGLPFLSARPQPTRRKETTKQSPLTPRNCTWSKNKLPAVF